MKQWGSWSMHASASVLLVLSVFHSSFAETMDIIITADNYFDLYVNDVFIDGEQGHEEWRTAEEYTVPVRNGKNVIAVLGMDGGLSEGVLAQITLPGGTKLGTSSEWKTSADFAFNWYSSGFDDSQWPSAMEIANAGSGAWGDRVTNFPSGSPAKWIWREGANPENSEDGSVSQFRFTFSYGSALDADFSVSKGNEASMSIDVSASGSDQHSWDFGDGATATGSTASHTYTQPGLYTVIHTVTGGGNTGACGLQVYITGQPAGYATLRVSGDNMAAGYVNGILIGAIGTWKKMYTGREIPLWPGKNVVAVQGAIGDESGAFIGEMTLSDGRRIGTNATSWKGSSEAAPRWNHPGFDDGNWSNPGKRGDYATGVWHMYNTELGDDTPAMWIWCGGVRGFARHEFDVEGSVSTIRKSQRHTQPGLHIHTGHGYQAFTLLGRVVSNPGLVSSKADEHTIILPVNSARTAAPAVIQSRR